MGFRLPKVGGIVFVGNDLNHIVCRISLRGKDRGDTVREMSFQVGQC